MEFFPPDMKLDIMGKAKYFLVLSLLTVLGSIYIWFAKGEAKYGVDFMGGHQFTVKVGEEATSESLRQLFSEAGFGNAVVQSFKGDAGQYTVRMGGTGDEPRTMRPRVEAVLKTAYAEKAEILQADYIGPTIGKELRTSAIIAALLALIGILGYVSYRFELSFAVGAVVALFHDVIIATGLYLYAGFEINMSTVAGALTIVGYSVNDTVVIFDRIREYLLKRKDYQLTSLMNDAISSTLSRTIVTNVLTLVTVAALLVFGGGAIVDLSFYLFVGIIAGTYSTIYVASPCVLYWERLMGRKHK
jgi:preprotein translocase subunit SecF